MMTKVNLSNSEKVKQINEYGICQVQVVRVYLAHYWSLAYQFERLNISQNHAII